MYDDIADIYLEIFALNQAFLDFIPEYLGASGSTVLDLGCGPGDYVDALAREGYRATGIDNSAGMIAAAQAKQGTFHRLSFTEIGQLQGPFDCAYSIGNSLSYLPREAFDRFLWDLHNLMAPGGRFVMQVVNWDRFRALNASDFPVKPLSEGRSFHRRYEWISPEKVIFHTAVRRGEETLGEWADPLYPLYGEETAARLEAARWRVTGRFGDYQKAPFDPQSSPALILTAQRNQP